MQRSKTKKSKRRKERIVIFPPMSKLPFHYGLQLRIYPSCEQMRIIHRNIDAGRWYYNQLVAWGRLRLPKTEGNFPVFDAMRRLRCHAPAVRRAHEPAPRGMEGNAPVAEQR